MLTVVNPNGTHIVVCEKCGTWGPSGATELAACLQAVSDNWDYFFVGSPKSQRFGEGRRLLDLPKADLRIACPQCRRGMIHQPESILVLDAASVERLCICARHESAEAFRRLAIETMAGSCSSESFPELHYTHALMATGKLDAVPKELEAQCK